LRERPARLDLVALGFALGCGWWASPQILILGLPAVAWLVYRRPQIARDWWLALPAAALGAAPWLIVNVRHNWPSLHVLADAGSPWSRLHNLVVTTLPTGLGLRVPFSLHWIGSVWLGLVLYAIAVIGLVVPARARQGPLLLVLVVFPVLYAASPYASLNREPRYVEMLVPIAALLLARWVTGRLGATVAIGVAVSLTVVGVAAMQRGDLSAPLVDDRHVPASFEPLLRELRANRVTHVWANYWVAWPIVFLSNERIVAASTGTGGFRYEHVGSSVRPVGFDPGRRPAYYTAVRAARDAAFVFVAGTRGAALARKELRPPDYRAIEVGGFVLELPLRNSARSNKA
jgi:hypothetical protein